MRSTVPAVAKSLFFRNKLPAHQTASDQIKRV